jgi:hypothetical protein
MNKTIKKGGGDSIDFVNNSPTWRLRRAALIHVCYL